MAPVVNSITPFFIVDDLQASLEFYQSKLGFEIPYKGGDGIGPDFWGMVRRDGATLMLKHITPEVHPQPNHSRHEWAPWDAYINTPDPDALYDEYARRDVRFHSKLSDSSDGLRAFEVMDNSGYVLCFGCPKAEAAEVSK